MCDDAFLNMSTFGNCRFCQFVQKHRGDKEWTDDFAIMTNVRISFLPVKQHVPIKSSFPKANESGSLADHIAIDTFTT